MSELMLELTDGQKIEILERAAELLGPNGENWTKSCWWGIKLTDDQGEDVFTPGSENRVELDEDEADEANVWCLMGALEEAAYRLGIVPYRVDSERLAAPISLRKLVDSNEAWAGMQVIDVNDNPSTSWNDIKGIIEQRLAELRTS